MRKMRTRKAETVSAKLSAAKAEPKKPASVMPIWMVERNWVGVSMMRSIFFARLSPSEARARTFFSFREITAISVAAKNALHKINTICRISCFNIVQKNLHRFCVFSFAMIWPIAMASPQDHGKHPESDRSLRKTHRYHRLL